jgi:hypothetical protein
LQGERAAEDRSQIPGEIGVEKRAECLISKVMGEAMGEAIGNLVVFAGEPLREKNGQVVDQ